MRILCPECGNSIWKYVTERKNVYVGNNKFIVKETTKRICTKCQKELKTKRQK